MNFILCNIYMSNDSYLEQLITNELLKTVAYNAKIKDKKTKQCSFLYVLVPIISIDQNIDYSLVKEFMAQHTNAVGLDNENYKIGYTVLYNFFKIIQNYKFTFDIVTQISDKNIDIHYTDGSSSLKQGAASYACVTLKEESYDEDTLFDELTQTNHKYESKSGFIQNGTNNIGELTGIKTAVENSQNNLFQIVISDSEYSVKSFREWIYNWKTTNYKGSNKKQILNCDLIKEIQNNIENSNKIYLFKWTKGHADTPFNELCDHLAKIELGLA